MTLDGRLFEAGSSRCHAARLSVVGQSLQIVLEGGKAAFSVTLHEMALDPPIAGIPRRATLSDGRIIEVPDQQGFNVLLTQMNGGKAHRLGLPRFGAGKWGALIFAAITMPVLIWVTYPIAADQVANYLPREVDRAIGQGVFEQMDGLIFQPSELETARQERLLLIHAEMQAITGEEMQNTRLLFRKSEQFGANALAFPDGTLVLLDDLVLLAEHEDELAAVIAHEMGHVLHRHSLRQIIRASGVTIIATLILGESVSALEEILAIGLGGIEFAFSREFELEADVAAHHIMEQIGRDARPMIDLLRRISEDCGKDCEETSLFSTHPGLKDRLKAIEQSGS
jgi:Zn-dependent protease with chaperone function